MNGLLNSARPQQKQGRQANESEQKAYNTMVKQVITFLMTNDDIIDILEQTAQQKGPAQALAYVVSQAIGQVGQAAMNAGVDVAKHTGMAALGEILTVIATVMKQSGMLDDVEATVQEATDIIMGGGQQPQQPQQMNPQQPMQGA